MKLTLEMLRVLVPFVASTAAAFTGYDLMKRTGLSKQASYRIAHYLADAGLLNSKVERYNPTFGLPPRTLYEATPEGVERAKAALDLLRPST